MYRTGRRIIPPARVDHCWTRADFCQVSGVTIGADPGKERASRLDRERGAAVLRARCAPDALTSAACPGTAPPRGPCLDLLARSACTTFPLRVPMLLLVLFVLLALLVSFTCSVLEAVLLSVTPAYVSLLDEQKHPAAARLRELRANVDRPLAAILSLNTVAHTVGAAGAGAQAAKVFGDAALGVFSGVLTLLVLVLSEIIPKTLGATHWKRLAPMIAPVLRVMILLVFPLVKLSEWISDLLTRGRQATVSREEIVALADEGKREGIVQEGESRVLRNLLRLSVLKVCNVMTPAEHVVAFPEHDRLAEIVARKPELTFSRLPLYRDEGGRRVYRSYVLMDEVLTRAARGEDERLGSMARGLLTVSEQDPLPGVFDRMAERREHIAIVHDADGQMCGIISMEDIIETLLGVEIFDEVDDVERIHALARSQWQKRHRTGRIPARPRGVEALGITGGAPSTKARQAGSAAETPPPETPMTGHR